MTEITHVEPLQFFVDEQRHGPYAIWHHEHHFRDLGNGRVEMRDIIHYKLPMGWLGQMVQPWLVAPRLNQIFDFRFRTVETLFG
jgi:ligand-binding SRPBCC domain-containing protein